MEGADQRKISERMRRKSNARKEPTNRRKAVSIHKIAHGFNYIYEILYACLAAVKRTSDNVGCAWIIVLSSSTVACLFIRAAISCTISAE